MTHNKRLPALLLYWTALLEHTSCFTCNRWNPRFFAGRSRLHATIYYGDGSSSQYFDENPSSSSQNPYSNLADSAHLARLAAAFSPSQLSLQNIEHVEVLGVDENHMDVEAVVCEDDGCVTLMVPLQFPHPCLNVDEECVLDNLEILDQQAEMKMLQQQEKKEADFDEYSLQLAQGWVAPPYAMAEECHNLVHLLNQEEFASDMVTVASYILKQDVQKTRVLAMGPSGIHLLVRLEDGGQCQATHFFDTVHSNMEWLQVALVQVVTMAVDKMAPRP